MDEHRKQVEKYLRGINTDRRPWKVNTRYDDYYNRFIRNLLEDIEELSHLRRPEKRWEMPRGVGMIRYSRFSPEYAAYLQRKKKKLGGGRRDGKRGKR